MRNASVVSFAAFLLASLPLIARTGNHGLWIATIFYVVLRALTLAVRYTTLRRSLAARPAATAEPGVER
jgi:Na+-driven multidrug efflux pump